MNRLNSGLGPMVREVTPGKPHPFDEYARDESERLMERFRNDPILKRFYKIVFDRFDWQIQRAIAGYNGT